MAVESSAPPKSRRALLAGALGGLAAAVATSLGRPSVAYAAAGDPLIIGSQTNNAGTADTQLLTNSSVIAFKLLQNGPGTALMGYATPATGATRGVYGRSDSPNGFGVQARNAGASGTGAAIQAFGGNNHGVDASTDGYLRYAVRGVNNSPEIGVSGVYGVSTAGSGVRGQSTSGSGVYGSSSTDPGVYGYSTSSDGVFGAGGVRGVYGYTSNQYGSGVEGLGGGNSGHGVVGSISQDSLAAAGVYGEGAGDNSYAGYFVGHVAVSGVIENAAVALRIDHPLDPANQLLRHSAVASPDMLNLYNGVATADARGEATIRLPAYVDALNRDFRYALTPIGEFAPLYVKSKLAKGQFSIAGAKPGQEVSWLLTGVRKDAWAEGHRITVEADKAEGQRGRYLHPVEHGRAPSNGVDYAMHQRLAAAREQAQELGAGR